MASSSGTSSGLSPIHNSGSEEDLQAVMDRRKRKRMLSNRESARRSRMRKQKRLDDLTAQLTNLRNENRQLSSKIDISTQHYLQLESENSIFRAQMEELTHRLESMNDIINFFNGSLGGNGNNSNINDDTMMMAEPHECFFNPMNLAHANQPIMACADIFQHRI